MKKPRPYGSMEGANGSKAFAHQLVSMFLPLGIDDARFSVVSFAANATTRVPWSYNESEINDGIDAMTADDETGTSISDGFEAVRQLFEIDATDGRENAAKIVLLLSDGEQSLDAAPGKTLLQTAVDAAKRVKNQNATVFAWGFGDNVSMATLRGIATDNITAVLGQDVAELMGYLDGLKAAICGDSEPMAGAPCPPPSPPPPSPPPPSPPPPSPSPPSPPPPSPSPPPPSPPPLTPS